MTDLTALEEAAKKAKALVELEDGMKALLPVSGKFASTVETVLVLISTLRSLERERGEAFKAGMMRAAEIAEARAAAYDECRVRAFKAEKPELVESYTMRSGCSQAISAAIRAEAKGSGG